jgi:hypothetical protein
MASVRRMPLGAAFMALAIVLAGCSNHSSKPAPTQPTPQPGFVADSPANAVRLFEWDLDHRDHDRLSSLFTDDFLFACAVSDSAGNAFSGHGLARLDLLEELQHLIVGGGTSPPANDISLQIDPSLHPQQDTRPGKGDTTYHQEILTSVVLQIETDLESFQVTGDARFFVVRGDSALIPQDQRDRGFRPDKGRWYIERLEDETQGGGGGTAALPAREARAAPPPHTMPAKNITLCSLLALYR